MSRFGLGRGRDVRSGLRVATITTAVAVLTAACGGPGVEDTLRIVYVGELSGPGAFDRTGHALQGLRLALGDRAGRDDPIEVVDVDTTTERDPTGVVAELADDLDTVAVVLAPFWDGGSVLAPGGDPLPVVSLSPWADPPDDTDRWMRTVAEGRALGTALAEAIAELPESAGGVCRSEPTSPVGREVAERLAGGLGPSIASDVPGRVVGNASPDQATQRIAAAVDGAGCGVLAWLGDPDLAALVRASLDARGTSATVLVGPETLKDPRYLFGAGAVDGTLVACACTDPSARTDLRARRFVNAYQAEFGGTPGLYAAEGWDAGRMLVRALEEAGSDRSAIARAIRDAEPFAGLAGRYAFDRDGERVDAPVRIYRAVGGLWLEETPTLSTTRVEGELAMAICLGRPGFASGPPRNVRGFDVEIAALLAEEVRLRSALLLVRCGPRLELPARVDAGLVPPAVRLASGLAGSRPVHSARIAFTVDRFTDDPPDGPDELRPTDRVGVVAGTGAAGAAEELVPEGPRIVRFRDAATAMAALAGGELVAVLADEPSTMREIEDRPGLQAVASLDTGRREVLAVPGGPAAVGTLQVLEAAVDRLLASGAYARAHARWFPGVAIPPEILASA